ncbi:MAG: hypothetical protein PSX71_01460 [bacterium]|nr:hypothetical protein [bacterium]
MSLTKKLSLAALVIVVGAGVSACDKKPPISTGPSTAEQIGAEAGSAQKKIEQGWDNSKQAVGNASETATAKVDAAADEAKAKAAATVATAKQTAEETASAAKASAEKTKEDLKKGYNSTKP